jgi:hypothetical protein
MIWESWYWKQPLLEMADRLRSYKSQDDLSEEVLVQIERDIFIGFYSIRKLIESVTKITDAAKALKIRLTWYPNVARVSWRNNHRLDGLYDFTRRYHEERDLQFIAGRIIHSFVFAPCINEQGGLAAILFASDRDKDEKLYSMEIDDVLTVFERAGNDDPQHIEWLRHPNGSETTKVS